jgi:hypothetical protein
MKKQAELRLTLCHRTSQVAWPDAHALAPPSRWNMDDPRAGELVTTIERTIVEHGFYILKNRVLGLVCGIDSAMSLDDPWTTELVQAFATKHGWPATLRNGALRFYPRAGSIQNAVSPVGA